MPNSQKRFHTLRALLTQKLDFKPKIKNLLCHGTFKMVWHEPVAPRTRELLSFRGKACSQAKAYQVMTVLPTQMYLQPTKQLLKIWFKLVHPFISYFCFSVGKTNWQIHKSIQKESHFYWQNFFTPFFLPLTKQNELVCSLTPFCLHKNY